MQERTDNKETPQIIKDLFAYPYHWVRRMNLKGDFLDVGCGERNLGKELLNAIGIDIAKNLKTDYIQADARNLPFTTDGFEYVLCFETIEHIKEQEKVLEELRRIAEKKIFISSINKNGPNFIEGVEIYKGDKNPYHLKELGITEFVNLITIPGSIIQMFHSVYEDGEFKMKSNFSDKGYSLYAIIQPLKL